MTNYSKQILHTFEALLLERGIGYSSLTDLSGFTYLRTGGTAEIIVFPSDQEKLSTCVQWLYKHETPYKVIGNTSNLLFLDDTIYSILISTSRMQYINYDHLENQVVADSGVMMPMLSRKALFESIKGFEGLEGIPGTIGGGVYMNAGAYGCEIKDTLLKVDTVLPAGTVKQYDLKDIRLGHRTSIFRGEASGEIISRCYFRAEKGVESEIYSKMELFHAKRHKYQDYCYPNLGSIFSGSPYRALAEDDKIYKAISALYYWSCYKWKLFRRESPINRRWINNVTIKRFGISYEKQPFSDKTLNCLVNRGQGTTEMVRFIEEMMAKTKGRIPIENEIVAEV